MRLLVPIPTEDSLEFLARLTRFQRYSGTLGESELAHFMIDATTGRGSRSSSCGPVQAVETDRVNARWCGSGGAESIPFTVL